MIAQFTAFSSSCQQKKPIKFCILHQDKMEQQNVIEKQKEVPEHSDRNGYRKENINDDKGTSNKGKQDLEQGAKKHLEKIDRSKRKSTKYTLSVPSSKDDKQNTKTLVRVISTT